MLKCFLKEMSLRPGNLGTEKDSIDQPNSRGLYTHYKDSY